MSMHVLEGRTYLSLAGLLLYFAWVTPAQSEPQATALEPPERVDQPAAGVVDKQIQAKALLRRAQASYERLEFAQAIADFSAALVLNDKLDAAYFGRGLALGRTGRVAEGIADLSIYIDRNPTSSRAYTKRGVRYLWLGDVENAERDLRRALALDADNAEAHDDLGVILARRGEHETAIEHFRTTVRLDPTYQKAYHNLAMVYFIAGQDHAALSAINQSLQLRAEARDSLLLKAEILLRMGQKRAAQRLREEAEFLPEGNWTERLSVQQ